MNRYRCEDCGGKFSSEYNFELHRELRDCVSVKCSEKESSSTKRTRKLRNKDRVRDVEGTVCNYNEDRAYGFLMTFDLNEELEKDTNLAQEVFFHISDSNTDWMEEGDRLCCDVIEGDKGLQCTNITVIIRDKHRDSYDQAEDNVKQLGFGHQKNDTKYGAGRKPSPSERKIEHFKDERKFR